MELYKILAHIAVPRPNHSEALGKTAAYIREVLSSWGIPFTVQEFTLRPYEHLLVGAACVVLALAFFYFILRKKPLAALIAALAIPALLLVEFEFSTPVVSPLVMKKGENIIMNFNAPGAVRELVFAAHYDSKTDFFDHIQRAKIYRWIPHFFALGVLLSLWVFLAKKYTVLNNPGARRIFSIFPALFVVYWMLVGLAFGGFIFLSDLSPGAIDDGGSVASLMELAREIKSGKVKTEKSNITILLTAGEEVGLQGAGQYVKSFINNGRTAKGLPVSLVNLELAGQNGNMIYWRGDGVFLKFHKADSGLIERLNGVWKRISGKNMDIGGNITDDALMFMTAGVPSITVGNSGVPGLGEGGFHSTLDNMGRLNIRNLDLMIRLLEKYIESYGAAGR